MASMGFQRAVITPLIASMVLLTAAPLRAAPAVKRSVAVVAATDGDADDLCRAAAEAIAAALSFATPLQVIDPRQAAAVGAYQYPGTPSRGEAHAPLLAAAKEHYFAFRVQDARAEAERALAGLQSAPLDAESGPQRLDAALTLAQIARSQGDQQGMRRAIAAALAVDPLLELAAQQYPPGIVRACEEQRRGLQSAPAGELVVESIPPAAEVLINGISRGVTPLTLPELPAGDYALTVRANRYRPEQRQVRIAAGGRERVRAKLAWARQGDRGAADGDSASAVREGVRLAEALRADMVVLVDAASAAGERQSLRLRLVDRASRAGMKPIEVPNFGGPAKNDQLAEITSRLARQLQVELDTDPARWLDPAGEADPVLMGKAKRPLHRRPLFWAGVGTAAAAAIIGGILASMSSGDSPGAVRIQFK